MTDSVTESVIDFKN